LHFTARTAPKVKAIVLPRKTIFAFVLAKPPQDNYNVVMSELHFIWDDVKNETNKKKHGVRFEEAQTVFFDESAMEFFDSEHSLDEDRFLILGQSFSLRILLVCHCYRGKNEIIRIISARKATAKERNKYQRNKL
jgi:uncharacterized DUF497 family protein